MHSHIEAFYRPSSIQEASALLQNPEQKAIAVAGATEVGLRVRQSVKALVDLSGLGLDQVRADDQHLLLGAMVRATTLANDPRIRVAGGDALPEAALAIASHTVRNLTTLGGNVVHLTSWSDLPPALLVLGAAFHIEGTADRWVDAEAMFRGQPRDLLEPGDLVTEVRIPRQGCGMGSAFIKYAKTAVDFALVNAAAWVTMDQGTITEARISVGAIHTPPRRMMAAEALLNGQAPTPAVLAAVAQAVTEASTPRSDMRASEDYLKRSAGVVARRVVEGALSRAQGGAA